MPMRRVENILDTLPQTVIQRVPQAMTPERDPESSLMTHDYFGEV